MSIALETPYKYGQRAQPKTREAYRADILERRTWNDGDVGELLAELPGPAGHPDPRVTVNVDKVQGGHSAAALQRHARRYHWMNVVRCYRLGAYKDQRLSGWTKARIEVGANGTVKSARLLSTKLADREVATCMASKLQKLNMPRAKSGTSAWLAIRVSPGDEPQPPPRDALEAGPGQLSEQAMRAGVRAGMASFEACYRQAFRYAPQLWGRIVVRFHVDRRGRVDEAFQTESRFPDARLLQCVLHAARALRFDKPRGGELRFEVPMRFRSDNAKTAPAHQAASDEPAP